MKFSHCCSFYYPYRLEKPLYPNQIFIINVFFLNLDVLRSPEFENPSLGVGLCKCYFHNTKTKHSNIHHIGLLLEAFLLRLINLKRGVLAERGN